MDNITPYFFDSLHRVVDANEKSRQPGPVMKLQVATLRKANSEMAGHYANTEAKISELDRLMTDANAECRMEGQDSKIEQHFSKVDDFDRKIEAMEENYEHLSNVIVRVGSLQSGEHKLKELEKLHKLIKQVK